MGGLENAAEVTRALESARGEEICVEIVRNFLKREGFEAEVQVSKPPLSPKNVKERLAFVVVHKF